MSEPEPMIPLDYVNPVDARRPYSVRTARNVKRLAWTPSGVGLAVTLCFACTGRMPLALVGVLWLYVGGAIGFVTGLTSLILFINSGKQKERNGPAHVQYRWALIASLLALPAAVLCLVLGAALVDFWHPDFD